LVGYGAIQLLVPSLTDQPGAFTVLLFLALVGKIASLVAFYWLVTSGRLAYYLHTARVSFAAPESFQEFLAVMPGLFQPPDVKNPVHPALGSKKADTRQSDGSHHR
jgi:hypothetical protein